jgi:LDH2 family malate/lactate/ureidoglycolate dehydrogenase
MSHDGKDRYFQGGFYIQAVDVAAFRDYRAYQSDMRKLAKRIRASKLAAGVEKVYLPGEPEIFTTARRKKEGIPVDHESWSYFEKTAKELGIPMLRGI